MVVPGNHLLKPLENYYEPLKKKRLTIHQLIKGSVTMGIPFGTMAASSNQVTGRASADFAKASTNNLSRARQPRGLTKSGFTMAP